MLRSRMTLRITLLTELNGANLGAPHSNSVRRADRDGSGSGALQVVLDGGINIDDGY